MFICFGMIHEHDRHTDAHTQTLHDDIGHACIASRGKNDDSCVNRTTQKRVSSLTKR